MSELETSKKNRKKRNNLLGLLALFFILCGGSYAVYYYSYGQYFESTDNAYVGQNIIYVTPQTSGSIDNVYVSEMQYVKAGELLGHIDSRNAQLMFDEAKSTLAKAVRSIKKLEAQKAEAQNAVLLAEVNLHKTQDDLKRNEFLIKKAAISDEKYKNIKYAFQAASANLEISKKNLLSLNAILKDANISTNPDVRTAALHVKQTYLDLKRCNIIAPLSGVIAKKNFTIGQNVGVQSALLSIVPNEGYWVDANFKETQIKHLKIGQKVTLTSDLYDKDVLYHGTIKGIAPGTGAVFSLLPAQNASGNWIKIVQRVPVRIRLNEDEVREHPLQVGDSMSVTVDVHTQKGDPLQHVAVQKNSDQNYRLYQNAIKESEDIVSRIIEQNS